ncbi:MAG TPA: response regulator [Ktedonobacterales bacterium]|jgi:DNA-binding response OmpR family regulator
MVAAEDKRHTVLVVDDDPDLLQLLTDGLELLGHFSVVGAENGIQGLEQFFEIRPDCMVIDVMMPGLDGYQLMKALRGDPESAATPLIMLTALDQDKNRFAGLASGADHYLIKPVTPRKLVKSVQQAIAMSAGERSQRLQVLAQESGELVLEE